jgi:Ecdysteroid kinase-like family
LVSSIPRPPRCAIEQQNTTMAASVTESSDGGILLPRLQHTFPSVTSYTIQQTIQQANAMGYILKMHYDAAQDDDANAAVLEQQQPSHVFIKHVDATVYCRTKKDWNDLRRTLMYARTEARVYRDFAPWLRKAGFADALPLHFAAEYNYTDWIPETEHATATVDASQTIDQLPTTSTETTERGGWLILECIHSTDYFQNSPLSIEQAKQCLSAVAALHVAAWENVPLLDAAAKQLSKASFHLDTRNPSELAGMETSWDHFCTEFQSELQAAGLWNASIRELGRRVAASARYISDQISPAPTDPYATIAHGDYKAMNVFLPKSPDDGGPAKIVDYASTGIGIGMSDVAMHVHHAVLPEHLRDGGEEELLRHYWTTVTTSLPTANALAYSWDVAWRHYRFAVVDYFRFFLGRFWKHATVESMRKMAASKNTCLLNRNVSAAMAFVCRVDVYLAEIEEEIKIPTNESANE